LATCDFFLSGYVEHVYTKRKERQGAEDRKGRLNLQEIAEGTEEMQNCTLFLLLHFAFINLSAALCASALFAFQSAFIGAD
jgi:hypothetical protein